MLAISYGGGLARRKGVWLSVAGAPSPQRLLVGKGRWHNPPVEDECTVHVLSPCRGLSRSYGLCSYGLYSCGRAKGCQGVMAYAVMAYIVIVVPRVVKEGGRSRMESCD